MTFIHDMRSVASDLEGMPVGSPFGSGPMPWLRDTPEQVALRQLRHHTKNALQRLLVQIAACPGLQRDPAGRALAHDLERRIHTSASLSDALFGFTHAPRSLEPRLRALGEAVVELMADGDQSLDLAVSVDGVCPSGYDDVLVRVAHELVGNAVKHGMHLRLVGKIELAVDAGRHGVTLSVTDDGWGLCIEGGKGEGRRGDGLQIAVALAEQHGGVLRLHREAGKTIATLHLPPSSVVRDGGL